MQKITKGVLALGAGLLLAIGSAGSLAYWQGQTSVGATTFTTGDLSLEADASTWSLNGALVTDSDQSPSQQQAALQALRLVPGDSLVWVQDYFIDQNGDGLYLALDVAIGGLTANAANPTAPVSTMLASSYTITPKSGQSVTFTETSSGSGTYKVTGKGEFTVTTTLAWPFGTTADTSKATHEQLIDFADTTLTLRQVPAPGL